MDKRKQYSEVLRKIRSLLEGEEDVIAMMSTITCELKHSFESFSWVGFYRAVGTDLLKVGPYQGAHGCIDIPFSKGVCGRCATERTAQIVKDVAKLPYHIACSAETRSEIVVPVFGKNDELIAVLDIDSNLGGNFDDVDKECLETICALFKI